MQGRTAGSSRKAATSTRDAAMTAKGRFGAGAVSDCITVSAQIGRSHGSRPALARSVLSMSLFAGALSALLIGSGVELGKIGLEQAVSSAQAATEIPMPRPRIQASVLPVPAAEAPMVLRASSAFAAVHDLDTELGSNAVDRVSYDFLLSESAGGDPNDILEFGPMKIRRHLVQTIVRAAQAVQTDPVLLMAVADKESSFITAVQAKTSSATGLYQFIERTWLGCVRDFGAKYGLGKEAALVVADANDRPSVADPAERTRLLELRRDPYLSALLAGEMLKRDAARIALRIGRDLSLGEVYLAHFLGPDDAQSFLAKVADKPGAAAAQLLPGPARANRTIFFSAARSRRKKAASLSVAEVHEKFEAMMSARGARYRDVRAVSGVTAYADAEAGAQ
ncbi:transglycosylase SLT domain-containing protein [uncultured Methylobacterium sp.]|uniref:transglycosylase SLT domain-containing protein n=1 Tax=uncultured Methylobacterium sp. TaxID=157278 RepID=UPI0035CA2FED